jgi:ABC-type nitrate/sulfonate/bicarbonate transport system permease component
MNFLGGTEEGTATQKLLFGILGVILVIGVWVLLTNGSEPILSNVPPPLKVFTSFGELFRDNEALKNIGFSLGLNISGYLEAILIVIPIGFLVGLVKYFRWGFQRQVDALRYIPLTAVTILFVLWFGIWTPMKVHFLAFGILIYLLPVMVQRIDEVADVYLKTVHTLGATDWQVLKTVYFPSVLSRLFDDIRVLTAISWTYIIVAEGINSNQGGIGALIYYAGQRQSRYDKVFALLIIIMIIGVIQDKIFIWLDKELFPFKYQASEAIKSSAIQKKGVTNAVLDFALRTFGWILVGIFFILVLNELFSFLGGTKVLSYIFGPTVWVINILITVLFLYKAWKWYQSRMDQIALQSASSKSSRA